MINSMAQRTHAGVSTKPRRRPSITAAGPVLPRPSSHRHRQRLLGAITDLAVSEGYAAVTVGEVIARARVSRATFYEHFNDIEECFAAALAPIRRRLLAGIRGSVASDQPEHAALRATQALLAFAGSRPHMARLLIADSLTGASRLRHARDELIDGAARIIEEAHERAGSGTSIPDLPPWLIFSVGCRLLATRLNERGRDLRGVQEALLDWAAAYQRPLAGHRWRALVALPPAARSPYLPPGILHAPPALTPGGPRTRIGLVAENQWSRIVFATAEVMRCDGYSAATVARITEVANLDARAFYRQFASKQQALAAVCELLFRHAMAVAAGAFVAGEAWPVRLWEAARALTQFADENFTLAYVSLIEGQAGGPAAMHRVGDLMRAFTIFLQDGPSQLAEHSSQKSELALDAIAAAVFELAYRHLRADSQSPLSTLLAPIGYLSLAPFLGPDAASEFVSRRTPQGGTLLASAA
jgi:AcrR family transcriptional regulator